MSNKIKLALITAIASVLIALINSNNKKNTTENIVSKYPRSVESENRGAISGGNVGNNVGRDISYEDTSNIVNQYNSGENGQNFFVVNGDVNNGGSNK